MKIITNRRLKYYIIIALSLFFLASASIEFGKEEAFFHGYLIKTPIIRVGLGVNLSNIKVSSSSGMKIYEVNPNYKLLAEDEDEVFIKGRKEKLNEKFVIQVFQTKDREKAEDFADDLMTKIEYNVSVSENPETELSGNFQVKVGDFLTRGDALSYIKKLNQIGLEDTWILREEITEEESKPLWIMVNNELKSLSSDTVLYFIPNHQRSFLSFNGKDYRGILILKATSRGIVLINILNLDDYLKSVVPSELSPYTYYKLEALKAQAVAARTYALRNMGTNEELGFDLSDSPNSQYYKGMRAEHPLSNRAVDMTRGEAALYNGRLINALYTSTCGGMTENVEDVFDGPPVPYLKSTKCLYDRENEWILKSKNLIEPIQVNGGDVSPDIAFLISLKVIPAETMASDFKKEASLEEAASWIKNSFAFLRIKNEKFNLNVPFLNPATFSGLVVNAFGWDERVKNLLLDNDRDYIIKNLNNLGKKERNNLAYLVQEGIFRIPEEIGDPSRPLTRGEVAHYLRKVIESYREMSLQGNFRAINGDRVELEEEEEYKRFLLSPSLFLLKNNGGESTFASQLTLSGGEEVRFIENGGNLMLLEVVYSSQTSALDQSSSFHRWKIRISRKALGKRVNQYYPIGELIDIVPQRRGDSKRVVEMLLKGKDGQAVVKGLRIRKVLGLSETLFVIDREYDKEGAITHFTFNGKGLGHGVGLCQVGAFGMALAGANYKDILKKYYHGIKINKIY
jgi:stage II sporulation protein D